MSPSGVDEFEAVEESDLRTALPILERRRLPLLVHAEWPAALNPIPSHADPTRYASWLESRPPAAELDAIAILVSLCREFRTRIHIVHLAAAEALPMLRAARAEGLPITVETCPHYLTFAAEEIPDGGVAWKCAPPVRSRENRERLWAALREGVLDLVVTDHSPCPPDMKKIEEGDFRGAWGGIASLQVALPAVWTGARERGFTVADVADIAEWMCAAPARLAGLAGRKGAIAPGYDADLVVWEPEATFEVDPSRLRHRHKITPYAGRILHGVVHRTLLHGETIFGDLSGDREAGQPLGKLLRRGDG
jgi:allantoinase